MSASIGPGRQRASHRFEKSVGEPLRSQSHKIAAALTEAARTINSPRTLEATLDSIVRAAQISLPVFDHIGVSITHRDGKIETVSATDQFVWDLDSLQYRLREGPCLDSINGNPVVTVEHVSRDKRWPNYMPRAAEAGLRSQLALRLYTEGETLGGLNLYSTKSDTIDPEAHQIAELFAAHAAIALSRTRREDQLGEALRTRKIIGQAIGLTMERYQISEDRAFQFLVRASQTSNIKLREIAQEVADTSNERYSHKSDVDH